MEPGATGADATEPVRRSVAALFGGVLTALTGLFLAIYYGGLIAWIVTGRSPADYLWMEDGSDESQFAATFFAAILVAYGVGLLVVGIFAALSRRGAMIAALALGFLATFVAVLNLTIDGGARALIVSAASGVANVLLAVALVRAIRGRVAWDDLVPPKG